MENILKKRVFPYNNGRTGNLWNKIVDLPPFKFDIKEDAKNVYDKFINYGKAEKDLEYSRL